MTVQPRDQGHPLLTDSAIEHVARRYAERLYSSGAWDASGPALQEHFRGTARFLLEGLHAARDGDTITIWRCDGDCGREWRYEPTGLLERPDAGHGSRRTGGRCTGTVRAHTCLIIDPADTEETE